MASGKEPGEPGYGKGKVRGSGSKTQYRPQRAGSTVDWDDCDPAELAAAIVAVTHVGDALLVGRSVDGGVLVLTVCAGDQRIKYYARSGEEMTEHLKDIIKATGYIG